MTIGRLAVTETETPALGNYKRTSHQAPWSVCNIISCLRACRLRVSYVKVCFRFRLKPRKNCKIRSGIKFWHNICQNDIFFVCNPIELYFTVNLIFGLRACRLRVSYVKFCFRFRLKPRKNCKIRSGIKFWHNICQNDIFFVCNPIELYFTVNLIFGLRACQLRVS